MHFIQNCAAQDISSGLHYQSPGWKSMLIQIADPPGDFPKPKHDFLEVHQFEFLDIEAADYSFDEVWRFSDEQAKEIVMLLRRALAEDMNVIVHCFAGVSRSGAVCEIGVSMGFSDTGEYRCPNRLVMHKMRQAISLSKNYQTTNETT